MQSPVPKRRLRPDQPANEQAWIWLRLLNSGTATEWDAQGFKQWLQQDPQHPIAFERAKRQWEQLPDCAAQLLQKPKIYAVHQAALHGHARRRRALLSTGVAAGAVCAGVALFYPPGELWPSINQWEADARTRTGEQRSMQVAQATLTLNTRTTIKKLKSQPGIVLLQGEAAIEQNDHQVFQVHAGAGRCAASASHFELRHLEGQTTIHCLQGHIRLYHPYGERVLNRQQAISYTDHHINAISTTASAHIAPWRSGELSFENAPLAVVIQEINRYRNGRVLLMNKSVANHPVSGRFQIKALDQALSQLQHNFELASRHVPGGIVILS